MDGARWVAAMLGALATTIRVRSLDQWICDVLSRFLDGAASSQVDLDRDEGSLNVKIKSAMWVLWVRLFNMEAENEHIVRGCTSTSFAAP